MTDDTTTTDDTDQPTPDDGLMIDAEFETLVADRFEDEDVSLHPRQWDGALVTPDPIAIIHGPPGTGKSTVSGFSAGHDILTARRPRRILLTGPTTRAVRELYGAFVDAWAEVAPGAPTPAGWSTTVRARLLTSPDCVPIDVPRAPEVLDHEEVNYRDGMVAGTLDDALTDPPFDRPTVIAGTPGKIDRLVDNMGGDSNDPRWDTVICDEASMIDASTLALATGPLAPFETDDPEGGRLYLVGDHRQLPVIRKAEWDQVRRPRTERHQPQAPALDLLRYINGHDVEFQTPARGDQQGVGQDAITYIPLERSYRMHHVIADQLQPVYARDELEFYSERERTLPPRPGPVATPGLQTALLPGPLTVIIHDDDRGAESNPTEVDIVTGLVRDVATLFPDESIGVVTPHNAQKTLLQSDCGDLADTVDTVNGFQGAGEDVLIASLTVASEAAQDREDSWLLDHRRLNVALSRARQKLIVVVPQTLLDFQPDKISTARDAQVLAELVGNVREAAASVPGRSHTDTTVQEMVGPLVDSLRSHGAAGVEIHTHPPDS